MKQTFTGSLTKCEAKMKDNVPYVKLSIKAKEFGATKAMLSPFQEADDGLEGAYNFVKSTGHGTSKYPLVDVLPLHVTFDVMSFEADLVSISIKKKVDKEGGECVEYSFELETDPTEDTTKLWSSYLNIKDVEDDAPADETVDGIQAVDAYYQEILDNADGKGKKKKKKSSLIAYDIVFESDTEDGTLFDSSAETEEP